MAIYYLYFFMVFYDYQLDQRSSDVANLSLFTTSQLLYVIAILTHEVVMQFTQAFFVVFLHRQCNN